MAKQNFEALWNDTLIQLRSTLGEDEFGAWFTGMQYVRSGENGIVAGVPSAFYRDKVKSRYQNAINSTLKAVSGLDLSVEFEVISGSPSGIVHAVETPKKPAGASPKSEKIDGLAAAAEKPKKAKHAQMRDDYTFEKYIIGENNNFAANAAIAISRNPGHAYNPFLIYGGVGLGKTHLMQAIGNYIHENSENSVICVTSEDFLNEYLEGIAQNKMKAFKNKFRYTDVLLVDDIQFFQDKPGVQEELFHTFNALLNAKKQLVFTCDRPPSELKKLSERLVSRFEQSLKVDLQPPRYEVRCAILKATAENRGVSIADEVIDLVGKNISSNIRDLISALNMLIAYTEIMGKPVTLEIAHEKLRDILASPRQANLSVDNIQRIVAEFFSLSLNDLKGKKRSQNIVFPRQIAMYIAREMTDYSTTELGQAFGGKDHTTVMHSIEKIKNHLITDPSLDATIESLKRSIKEYSAKS
jgi:chromosomal replication initiator protein